MRRYSFAKVLGVPVNDDLGEQVQPVHSEVLALGCSITDFTLATNAQGVFQRMMRFALIQADLGTALHIGIQQPIDDEQRPFDPADFAQCDREFVLSGIRACFIGRSTVHRASSKPSRLSCCHALRIP